MKSFLVIDPLKYDGTQLSSHFAYKNYGIAGDSVAAFIGPVEVRLTEMVDIEDVLDKAPIASDQMLSFIIETFSMDLSGTICLQRLFTAIIQNELNNRLGSLAVKRSGDDLFFDGRKLSVSIATASPISTMIHTALNIKGSGAPIAISCLEELGVSPLDFAEVVMKSLCEEMEGMEFARVKVNWVR